MTFRFIYRIFFCLVVWFALPGSPCAQTLYPDARPWTRLWWFADTTSRELITQNLDYLHAKGFGGVECAFIYPYNRRSKEYAPRHEWLSKEFTDRVRFAKEYASSLGMGLDVTFGTLWPFGDNAVPREEATMCLFDSTHTDSMRYLWCHPRPGLVIDHLSKKAFRHYADRLAPAFLPVTTAGNSPTLLFVDSWEVSSKYLGTPGFEEEFFKRYGYRLKPYIPSLYVKKDPYRRVLYDYRKLVSEFVLENFYREFTRIAHDMNTYSRGQAAGAPCDLIDAYAALDVPESEALLYEPHFGAIPASAAVLTGKKVVTSETFTCLYGFPANHFKKEQTADLKLLADAVLANGVNQIIWHGKPMGRTEKDTFYATVHIGSSGALDAELNGFNAYLTAVSEAMKKGVSYGRVAVYLPTEDAWVNGELPVKQQKIWSWGYYEMRENRFPEALMPWRPLWINETFLRSGNLENGMFHAGDAHFGALYVDAHYLDISALEAVVHLAENGFPVVMKRKPALPGLSTADAKKYADLLTRLYRCTNVHRSWKPVAAKLQPLVSGNDLPEYWCREDEDGLTLFFAHPLSKTIRFPMEYGQSFSAKSERRHIRIQYGGHSADIDLIFQPYQSLMIRMNRRGEVWFQDILYAPKTPVIQKRVKKKYERWEVNPANYTGACH